MLQLSQNFYFYFYAILPSPFLVYNFRIPKTNELIYLNTPTIFAFLETLSQLTPRGKPTKILRLELQILKES